MFKNILSNLLDRNKKKLLLRKLRTTTLDINYLCDEKNFEEISRNISLRKGIGNIELVKNLKNNFDKLDINNKEYDVTRLKLIEELRKIPNRTHPDIIGYCDEPKVLNHHNTMKHFDCEPLEFYDICSRLNLIRTDQLGNVSGNKSYYFLGNLARLEHALIRYTLTKLLKKGFSLVSVPDILPRRIIESCGMNTSGDRTQVLYYCNKIFDYYHIIM